MRQEELRQQYNALKTALDQGDITEKSFQESVNQLRYEDEEGVWHQLDAENGTWLCWEDDHWKVELEHEKVMKQKVEPQQTLPEEFWPLLNLILKNTRKMFFQKLPSTLLFMLIALALHTYLLASIESASTIEKFLSIAGSPLSGIVFWTLVPMLLVATWERLQGKSSGLGFEARLSAIRIYFHDSRKDATAMILASVGLALTIGALMSGYASFLMAVGVGTLLASKSGSVIALLFRSAWASLFGATRRENVTRYGLAAGYVTLFASSLGFVANSLLTPHGVIVGILLLVASLSMAKMAKIPPVVTPLFIPGLIILGSSFFDLDILWAMEYRMGSRPEVGFVDYSLGVGSALGAGFGLLLQRVLQDMTSILPDGLDGSGGGTLLDENGNPRENDLQNRPEWSLMNRTNSDDDWDQETKQWVHKDTLRKQRMGKDGYVFDEDGQVWRKPPPEIKKVDISQENGDASRIELKVDGKSKYPDNKVFNSIYKNFSYGTSTKKMENRFDQLDKAERDAIDEYKRTFKEYENAVKLGDKWLANQWAKRRQEAKNQVSNMQQQKDDLTDRVNRREQRTQKAEKRYKEWKASDAAKEVASIPYHMIRAMVAPDLSDVTKALQEAVDAQKQLQGHINKAPNLYKTHDETIRQLKVLNKKIKDARNSGKTDLERALRKKASGVRNRLKTTTNQLNEIHDANIKWQRKAPIATLKAYQASANIVLDGTSVPGAAKMTSKIIDQYRRGNLPGQHRGKMSIGGNADADLPGSTHKVAMDSDDLKLHHQALVNRAEGTRRVNAWSDAHKQRASPEEIKKRSCDILENRQAKLKMKRASLEVQRQYAEDVSNHRTEPLFEGLAKSFNEKGAYVKEGGVKRPVKSSDLVSGSGHITEGNVKPPPGMDLDIYAEPTIYSADGKPIKSQVVEGCIYDVCKAKGMNPVQMEIHYIDKGDSSAYRTNGQDPATYLSPDNVKNFNGTQGADAHTVTQHKTRENNHLNPADKLEEVVRGATKDFRRVTEPLLEVHPNSRIDHDLKRGVDLIDDVGAERCTIGEANAKSKQELKMPLEEVAAKLSSLQESTIKLDPSNAHHGSSFGERSNDFSGGNTHGQ